MMRYVRRTVAALLVLVGVTGVAQGQERGAAAVDQLVRSLAVTGRVLMIAAHPDDEDTRVIAWLTRGRGVETAYLSLTRGDGGQNLIGNELGEALGAIRTEELLAARRVDGGHQYFTRAFDFGFSKNSTETFKHWPHDSLLGDVVTVIRAFRPQVVISVWSGTAADGHGHHTVAGILAKEGFDAAGDTVRFPAAKFGQPWEPAKFYRTTGFNRVSPTMQINVGEFDPVLGRSYAEIAAESRAQHRSQGFGGVQQPKGMVMAGLRREASRVNAATPAEQERSIFDGVDTTFARFTARSEGDPTAAARGVMRAVQPALDSARRALDVRKPGELVPLLARATEAVQGARESAPRCGFPRRSTVLQAGQSPALGCSSAQLDLDAALTILARRLSEATVNAAGVAVETLAPKELLAFGDSMPVSLTVYNRGNTKVSLKDVRLTGRRPTTMDERAILPDSAVRIIGSVIGLVDTRPWWLGGKVDDMFAPRSSPADGIARVSTGPSTDMVPAVALAEDVRRESNVVVTLQVAGHTIAYNAGTIIYKLADAVLGQQDRPVGGVPPVTLSFDRNLQYVVSGKPTEQTLTLTLQSYSDSPKTFTFRTVVPPGLRLDSIPASVTLAPNERRQLFLRLRGSMKSGRQELGVVAESETGRNDLGLTSVEYSHIRPVRLYRAPAMWVQAVDMTVPATLSVAYVQGVGDAVAPFLQMFDIPVAVVKPSELAVLNLSRYSTLVIGPRAYQANKELIANSARVIDFARKGGTVVVQYGQTEMATPGVLPYPIALAPSGPAARVTEEDAKVTVLDPKHKLLNWPNKIGDADWSDWVQERAVYMPSTIDAKWQSPLEMHDSGEGEQRGALLVAPVGKGMFVYTTLSLFRQIPGGVGGGPRLFVNMLSVGTEPPLKKVQP